MIFFIFNLLLVIVGIILIIIDRKNHCYHHVSLASCLILIGSIMACASYFSYGPVDKISITEIQELIPINGYYVNIDGKYVTKNDLRGKTYSFPQGINEHAVVEAPVLIIIEKHHKATLFIYLFDHISNDQFIQLRNSKSNEVLIKEAIQRYSD